ncbi:MAG: hypothetical protein PF447_09870, partial [Spirochaetaceae bacterium]|jgi:hypothetical protein|nr:hypothetical protein [Spirochaetaceae bacterium]
MARLNLITGEYGRLELVVVPWFTPDTQASSGSWMMAEALGLESDLESFIPTYALLYETAYAAANPLGSASLATAQRMAAFQEDAIRWDTQKLSYIQWGLRYTQTLGPMDWGVSAARSYIRTPIANPVDLYGSALMSPAVLNIDPHYELMFTPMYMGAFEMAVSLWDLNIRHEAAVKLTEDLDGSKANIHNPRMEWLLGFDSNLPVSNLNINLQGAASYILFTEGITDSSDADYNADEYTHRIMGSISDSLFYDQLGLSLSGSYNIEDQDFMLIPEIEWNIKDSVTISTTYRLYSGKDDSLFGQFDQQDNLEILFDMSF